MAKKNYTVPTGNFKNLLGKRFGRLLVVEYAGRFNNRTFWKVACDCGTAKNVMSNSLIRGLTKSCGCFFLERVTKHGHTGGANKGKSPEYRSWQHMIDRCLNPKHNSFHNYGGRGITVHPRYMDFGNFISDLGLKPGPKYSIDRIDGNKHYEPGNLRWATRLEQNHNMRTNHLLTFKGKTKPLNAWARELGIGNSTIRGRLNKEWSVEDALTIPGRKYHPKCSF